MTHWPQINCNDRHRAIATTTMDTTPYFCEVRQMDEMERLRVENAALLKEREQMIALVESTGEEMQSYARSLGAERQAQAALIAEIGRLKERLARNMLDEHIDAVLTADGRGWLSPEQTTRLEAAFGHRGLTRALGLR